MIQLWVRDYCHECEYFCPEARKSTILVDGNKITNTTVTCESIEKCSKIYNTILKEMEEKKDEGY